MERSTAVHLPLSMRQFRWAFLLAGFAVSLLAREGEGQLPPASDPPYIPTPLGLVDEMLDMAGVTPADTVYDLGSGDGRIPIRAAERGAHGVGIEYAGWLVERSWANADSAGVRDRVSFLEGDVFEADVSDATVVTLYLGADFNRRLRPRLLAQLAPGSRIVSHGFHLDGWTADRTRTIGSGAGRATLYYWVVPARLDGFWLFEMPGAGTGVLELEQEFQRLQGEVRVEGASSAPLEGDVLGETITFRTTLPFRGGSGTFSFEGSLRNGRLAGIARGPAGVESRWSAVRFSDPSLSPPAEDPRR
jgi:SAM-dependent methyltransferase